MEDSTAFLLFFFLSIVFGSFLFLFQFLEFQKFISNIKILDEKRRQINILQNSNINIELSKEQNDLEKAIIKNCKVFDMNNLDNNQNNLIFESHSLDDITKVLCRKSLFYIKENNYENEKNIIANENQNIISLTSNYQYLILEGMKRHNNLFAYYDILKNKSVLRKPLLIIVTINLFINVFIHIIVLASFSYDSNRQVEMMFVIPFICSPFFILNELSKISFFRNFYSSYKEKNLTTDAFLYLLLNIFYCLLISCFITVIQIDDWGSPYNNNSTIYMLIPSIVIDFLIIRNFLVVFFVIIEYFIKKIKFEKSLLTQILKKRKKSLILNNP